MAKCDSCKLLVRRTDGRKIICKERGLCGQRLIDCNRYVVKVDKRVDMLSWAE